MAFVLLVSVEDFYEFYGRTQLMYRVKWCLVRSTFLLQMGKHDSPNFLLSRDGRPNPPFSRNGQLSLSLNLNRLLIEISRSFDYVVVSLINFNSMFGLSVCLYVEHEIVHPSSYAGNYGKRLSIHGYSWKVILYSSLYLGPSTC